jgi:hypothetical protein
MPEFHFGADAVTHTDTEPAFLARRDEILAAVQPSGLLESIFAEELLHASWEMERVRHHHADTAATHRLDAAYGRASRNWQRATRQLQALQSARASHIARLDDAQNRELSAACPLANASRVALPTQSNPKEIR